MSDRPIKLAVIGLGMAAKPHLAALKQLSGQVEVAGLYARSADRRAEMAQRWGWPAFDSIDDIAASDADGAIVITPPNALSQLLPWWI